jgi:hypothetical protein
MRKTIYLLLILICTGSFSQSYILTTDPETFALYKSQGTLMQNKVILIPKEYAKDKVLVNAISMIKMGQYHELEKYLNSVDQSSPYLPLANGLLDFFDKKYYGALEVLKKNNLKDLQFVVDLLAIDCDYELALMEKKEIDLNKFLEKYQKVIDTYNMNDHYMDIINCRIKCITYGK